MKAYNQLEPTIDECTEESRDTSIDQRVTDRSQKSFSNINFEFGRLRFGRKFRPKSLDPSKQIPDLYSSLSNTPKMNKSKEYVIFDPEKFHNPFIELDNVKSDTYEKRIVISPINSTN